MEEVQISFDLVGSELGEDIFSEQEILLLKKGTVLKEIHVLLLQKYRFGKKVRVDLNTNKSSTKEDNSPSAKYYQSIQDYIKNVFHNLYSYKEIDLLALRMQYHELIEISLCDFSILKVIQNNGKKNDNLYQHSINVGILSAMIGKLLGYKKNDCLLLSEMGLFHDIGILGIDNNLYDVVESCNIEEHNTAQYHTELGYNLLKDIPELNQLVPLSALQHHERLNGNGYPNQLKESEIPYFVQIISVASSFNAICMDLEGVSKKWNPFTGVYKLINAVSESHLNPAIVIPFVRYIMRQNLHQYVTLSNGKEAQIIFIHENEPHQPLVKFQEVYIDLRKESSLKIVSLMDESPKEMTNYN
ncbi:HD-GYP domain-containing protein (c-di-GMP phosphodiesterase class II) [Cytobacillus eiseniae]|uniref:HD-GYP domain-containing protein (C-di-GMP phosphodiesterase class II) n=1 Tax=Cytobacillus eiseniae TaxID=762947 RepID=A0ABS4RGI0_9BACI|nr:HD domain-containing phosphohydrolase [Cytobacillus eiseniae]MBP2242000.1 HD-GYP domain-containing protein (c-di-GMP phosphodiesterase class II) [Cytobacillus eiseniae]